MSVNINVTPQQPGPRGCFPNPGMGMPGMGFPGMGMPGGNGGGVTLQINQPGEDGKCCGKKKKKKDRGLIGNLLRALFGGRDDDDKSCKKGGHSHRGHGHGHGFPGHRGGAPSIAINVMNGNRGFGF